VNVGTLLADQTNKRHQAILCLTHLDQNRKCDWTTTVLSLRLAFWKIWLRGNLSNLYLIGKEKVLHKPMKATEQDMRSLASL